MKQMLPGKTWNLIFSLKLALMSGILVASSPNIGFAATGDILYQNCTSSGSCTGAGSNNGWTRSVVSSGCKSGSCLKLVGSLNSNNGLYGAGSTSLGTTSVKGKTQITISHWTKYSEDANSISDGNIKLDRAYTGSSASNFYATSISPSFGKDLYMGAMVGTMINKASWFDMVESTDNSAYPVKNANGTYTVDRYIKGSITSSGPQAPGTSWVKVTKWLKLPSTPSGRDGAVKVWIGNDLIYELINAGYSSQYMGGTTFTKLNFYPSSEATEPFEHWEDEMIIYEGYVPPSGSDDDQVSTPPDTNALPSAVADFKLNN